MYVPSFYESLENKYIPKIDEIFFFRFSHGVSGNVVIIGLLINAAVVCGKKSLFDTVSPSEFDLKTFCLLSDLSELIFDGKDLAFNFVMV